MPSYVDSAFAYLQAWNGTFRQDYRAGVADYMKRFGKTTRIMPMRRRRLQGSSLEYEVKARVNRSTRVTRNLMAAIPDPDPGEYLRFTVNMDHTAEANNDFAAFEVGFRTTIWDIWKRADTTWKDAPDFIRKDVKEGLDDVKETFAKYIHLPADGRLSVIEGIRDDDDDRYDSATTPYTAGTARALIKLDPTAVARIGDGQLIEIRDATGTVRNDYIRVRYVHPFEQTIAVEPTSDSATQNFNTVAAADEIFLQGSYGVNTRGSLAELFDPTQAYYGRGRLPGQAGQTYAAVNRILIPIRIDAGAGGNRQPLSGDHLRYVGESVAWGLGDAGAIGKRALVMSRFEFRAISRIADAEGIKIEPALASEAGRKLIKTIGFDGFLIHDPNLGTVMAVIDDFAEPGQIDFLNMEHWEIADPIAAGFRMLPGAIAGIWTRNTESDGSGRPSKVYSAQGIQVAAFVCMWPKGQVRLMNLTIA